MTDSKLYDEKTFYQQFKKDLLNCKTEVIIESPFITSERTKELVPIFQKLLKHGVKVYIFTRDPIEHTESMEVQSEDEITNFEAIGVQVFLCLGNHHRKLAILDRKIVYEGSLNILSQTKSREIMRRIDDEKTALDTFDFLKLYKFV